MGVLKGCTPTWHRLPAGAGLPWLGTGLPAIVPSLAKAFAHSCSAWPGEQQERSGRAGECGACLGRAEAELPGQENAKVIYRLLEIKQTPCLTVGKGQVPAEGISLPKGVEPIAKGIIN